MSWYGGLCYGFPLVALTMYVWLRKDLIEDRDLRMRYEDEHHSVLEFPKTLREFRQLALFLAKSGSVRYGLALQGQSRVGHGSGPDHLHPGLYHEWLNFLYAFGGRVLEQEFGWEYGPIVVNSPEAIESLNFYSSLYSDVLCHPDSLKFTWDDVPRIMLGGGAAMCVMWNDAVYDVASMHDGIEFCFGVLPGVDGAKATQSDGWSMLVPLRARDPEDSYAFMEWILEDSIQVELQRMGGASPVRSVYSDSVVRSLPYTEVSLAAMEMRVPRETIPESEAIWKVLTKQLEKVIRKEVPARRALCEAARQLERDVLAGKTAMRFEQ
jgi:ABC-type glycerol-3-phosphate transport system substrate-binding protein